MVCYWPIPNMAARYSGARWNWEPSVFELGALNGMCFLRWRERNSVLRKESQDDYRIASLHDHLSAFVDLLLDHNIDLNFAKRELEAQYIKMILTRHHGHIGKSARALGIHRNTLTKRIRDLKINLP